MKGWRNIVVDGVKLKSAMTKMTPEEFNFQYMCEFKPDPIIRECVEFLRHATPRLIADYKHRGLFSADDIKAARWIIEDEESNGA